MRLMRVRGNGEPTKVLNSMPSEITRAWWRPKA